MLCIGGLNEVSLSDARIVPMPGDGRNRPDKRCEGQAFRPRPKTYNRRNGYNMLQTYCAKGLECHRRAAKKS
jgi:hypothetical protein